MHRRMCRFMIALVVLFLTGAAPSNSEVVWNVETDQKLIALTFDDGPNPVYTPQILDLLNQYGAKGTFFVIGKRVQMYPAIAIREVNEGHEIANHTFDHHYLKNFPPERLVEEIRQTQEVIFDITEQMPHVFRPPGGFYNDALLQSVKKDQLTVVMWSWYQDTQDWKKPGVDKIVRQVLDNAHNGDIVLFHDLQGDCTQTVEALKQILPELTRRGYQFVTVSDLIAKTRK
ncbi:polysaccharide deacetylase family protein [Paenibacillus naphthalenovorans]|uniref:Chitooligosaccharide deacetylase n=2 Tax=Paenibacillus TaxID=44249 RepID=A0A0U2WD02_9BACL|nr:polysaccharide deacetylase family protein [Paenibacillus naphthalenovorans]ALS25309.1 chitooligosaccharide deacetylase [Paenibacillus naphthalenovorans]GCL74736.1 chitooligosaccharide deacetylase [Paenibacillus naphthalenovorans]SDJ64460.1 polysaccharide deacetylase family sporulation protein PdaB [Paenibacillus naphthalenovorans]